MLVFTILMLRSGAFWTGTYLLIIRRSSLEQTYGMPLVALCAGVSLLFHLSVPDHPAYCQSDMVFPRLDHSHTTVPLRSTRI